MADKTIGSLPKSTTVQDDSLLVMEQQGEARSVTGALVKQYARESVSDYADQAAASAKEAKNSANDAAASKTAAAASARDAKTSQDAAAKSAEAAESSETSAASSKSAAETSAQRAANSASEAAASQTEATKSASDAKASETAAQTYAVNAKSSENAAQASQNAAEASAETAKSEAERAKGYADTIEVDYDYIEEARTAAQSSASAAATSATNAKKSEDASAASAADAKNYQTAAETSASSASTSEQNAKISQTAAADSASEASASASEASKSQTAAADSASLATASATNAASSADSADSYAKQAKSYAVGDAGGARENEDVDNSKYYYEQAKLISQGLAGALLPIGTIKFSGLEMAQKDAGYMYNISDAFTTDATFKEGSGFKYPAGTNVYYTNDGYWDCLAGTLVTSVNGEIGDVKTVKSLNGVQGDIVIGGRNLALDTGKEKTKETRSEAYMGDYWELSDHGKDVLNVVGQKFVYSFDAKADVTGQDISFDVRIGESDSLASLKQETVSLTNEYKRYSKEFSIYRTGVGRAWTVISPAKDGQVGKIYVKNVKVELGNVAMDWTPAPEDEVSIVDNMPTDYALMTGKTPSGNKAGFAFNISDKAVWASVYGAGGNEIFNQMLYSSDKQPPYPVTSVNAKTGAVTLGAGDIKFTDGETFQAKLDAGKLKGDTGADGKQGPKGDTGSVGPTGPAGPAGPAGTTPKLVAAAGNDMDSVGTPSVTTSTADGTTTFTFHCLKGAKGDTGSPGAAGGTGPQGPAGPTGPAGPNSISTSTESSVNGLLKGVNGKVAAAVAGSDYVIPSGLPTNAAMFLAAHPVGSYYWSNNAASPASLFGGTWEQIKDRFVLAAGDTYGVNTSGGEVTHTLTVEEMPSHRHTMHRSGHEPLLSMGMSGDAYPNDPAFSIGRDWSSVEEHVVYFDAAGGSQSHNNMPPYIAAYCWRRTA